MFSFQFEREASLPHTVKTDFQISYIGHVLISEMVLALLGDHQNILKLVAHFVKLGYQEINHEVRNSILPKRRDIKKTASMSKRHVWLLPCFVRISEAPFGFGLCCELW